MSLVITIVGAVFWLSTMYSKVQAHEISLERLAKSHELSVEKDENFKIEVIERLSRIETKIKH